MHFRITGLAATPFQHLFGLSDEALAAHGAVRYVADSKPGFPDRITLRDAEVGETLLLLNYAHQPADTPYRASHAIFVLESAESAYDKLDEIPPALLTRTLSLRAFDQAHMMLDGDLVEGRNAANAIRQMFADTGVAYIHAHYAKRGCYAARIDRVEAS